MTAPREVSEHQIVAEWSEARQMLNDHGLSDVPLPGAIDILLGYRSAAEYNTRLRQLRGVVDLAEARSKRNHPSTRRRADLAVPPEVTP